MRELRPHEVMALRRPFSAHQAMTDPAVEALADVLADIPTFSRDEWVRDLELDTGLEVRKVEYDERLDTLTTTVVPRGGARLTVAGESLVDQRSTAKHEARRLREELKYHLIRDLGITVEDVLNMEGNRR